MIGFRVGRVSGLSCQCSRHAPSLYLFIYCVNWNQEHKEYREQALVLDLDPSTLMMLSVLEQKQDWLTAAPRLQLVSTTVITLKMQVSDAFHHLLVWLPKCCVNLHVSHHGSLFVGCNTGDVRLVGGADEFEGQIEVCYNNQWGTVCDIGYWLAKARAVCSKLGYSHNPSCINAQ